MRTSASLVAILLGLLLVGILVGAYFLIGRSSVATLAVPSTTPGVHSDPQPSATTSVSAPTKVEPDSARISLDGELPVGVEPLWIELVDAEEQPLALTRFALLQAGALLTVKETDAAGRAKVASGIGQGELIVVPALLPPARIACPLKAGEVRLTLPVEPALIGRLRVDGVPPERPVSIELRSDRPWIDLQSLPSDAIAALDLGRKERQRLTLLSDAEGAFRCPGLSTPFSGELRFPPDLWVLATNSGDARPERRSVRLTSLVEGMVIDLTLLPTLRGRVVEGPDRRPVAGVLVEASVELVGATDNGHSMFSASQEQLATDADGRFALPVAPRRGIDLTAIGGARGLPPPARAYVVVSRRVEVEGAEFSLLGREMAGPWDVGELVLEPARTLRFFVHDPAGAPIEGAVAYAGETSEPSGPDGFCELREVSSSTDRVEVGAVGWLERELMLAGQGSTTIDVELARSTRLELTFVDTSGQPVDALRVQLLALDRLFEGEDQGRMPQTYVASGASKPGASRRAKKGPDDQPEYLCAFTTDQAGRVLVSGLAPGVEIAVQACDELSQVLKEERVTLAAGEWSGRTIEVSELGEPFAGRVVDALGVPVVDANVSIARLQNGRPIATERRSTDATGAFRFEHLQSGRLRLAIDRDGFASLLLAEYEPILGETAEFRLQPAGLVVLHVVDASGRPIAAESLRAKAPSGVRLEAHKRDAHTFELRNAPIDLLAVSVVLGGRSFDQEVDARVSEQDFVVPNHGSAILAVRFRSPTPPGARHSVSLQPKGGGASERWQEIDGDGRAILQPLLPGTYLALLWRHGDERGRGERERVAGPVEVVVVADELVQTPIDVP